MTSKDKEEHSFTPLPADYPSEHWECWDRDLLPHLGKFSDERHSFAVSRPAAASGERGRRFHRFCSLDLAHAISHERDLPTYVQKNR